MVSISSGPVTAEHIFLTSRESSLASFTSHNYDEAAVTFLIAGQMVLPDLQSNTRTDSTTRLPGSVRAILHITRYRTGKVFVLG